MLGDHSFPQIGGLPAETPTTDRTYTSPADSNMPSRTTLRVRNLRESVVYHLLFDGDIGKLTGLQLKTHVHSICHIPPEQQILTFNGQPVHNSSTGYNLDLKNGGMLLLDYVARPAAPAEDLAAISSHQLRSATTTQSRSPSRRQVSQPPLGHVVRQPTDSVPAPSMQRRDELSRLESEIERIRQQEELILKRQDELRRNKNTMVYGRGRENSYPSYAVSGLNDEVDFDVEVVEERDRLPWLPANSVDVEESRTLQQDYVWKMEQVRFETERMNRLREMRRQQQELEYQAELLDRERIELERKTHLTRNQFEVIQRQVAEEMSIEARFIPPSTYA